MTRRYLDIGSIYSRWNKLSRIKTLSHVLLITIMVLGATLATSFHVSAASYNYWSTTPICSSGWISGSSTTTWEGYLPWDWGDAFSFLRKYDSGSGAWINVASGATGQQSGSSRTITVYASDTFSNLGVGSYTTVGSHRTPDGVYHSSYSGTSFFDWCS